MQLFAHSQGFLHLETDGESVIIPADALDRRWCWPEDEEVSPHDAIAEQIQRQEGYLAILD